MVCFRSSLNKNASKHGNIKLGIAGQQGSIIVRGWLRLLNSAETFRNVHIYQIVLSQLVIEVPPSHDLV